MLISEAQLREEIPAHKIFGPSIEEIVSIGKTAFDGTGITNDDISVDETDIKQVQLFWREITYGKFGNQYANTNWLDVGGPVQHFAISGKLAYSLAKATGQVDPATMSIVGWLHDLGRSKTHAFYYSDKLSDALLDDIGVAPAIKESMHKIDWYWNAEKPLDVLEVTPAQCVSVLADTLAKKDSATGKLRRPATLAKSVDEGKLKYLQLPIETEFDYQLRRRIATYSSRERKVLRYAIGQLESMGVDFEDILSNLDPLLDVPGQQLIN